MQYYFQELNRIDNERLVLLRSLFPPNILPRLLNGNQKVISDYYSQATIIFSDLAGFTEWSSSVTADEVVRVLGILM